MTDATSQKIAATPKVISVDWAGADVEIGGRTTLMEWSALRKAAVQSDRELAVLYSGILASANSMARRGSLTVRVVRCQNQVGHRVAVYDVSGADVLFSLPERGAGDGLEHHGGGICNDGYCFALAEAKEIFARLGARARLVI